MCEVLAEAQEVTSTTNAQYMRRMMRFRRAMDGPEDSPEDSEDSDEESLPHGPYAENSSYQEQELSEEFLKLVKEAENVPGKFATLETCASLHVYTGIMIEGLVEESAKVIKFNAVGRLADKLEEIWRDELGANLQELLGWPL